MVQHLLRHSPCSPFPHHNTALSVANAVAPAVLGGVLTGFLPHVTTLIVNVWDKIGVDCDTIGRKRTIVMMEEKARAGYVQRSKKVNIAIWNMHLHEDHHFEDIIESDIVPMGNGGGFRIVTFLGAG